MHCIEADVAVVTDLRVLAPSHFALTTLKARGQIEGRHAEALRLVFPCKSSLSFIVEGADDAPLRDVAKLVEGAT